MSNKATDNSADKIPGFENNDQLWCIDFGQITEEEIKDFPSDGRPEINLQLEKTEEPPLKVLILSSRRYTSPENTSHYSTGLVRTIQRFVASDLVSDSFFPSYFDLIVAQGQVASVLAIFPKIIWSSTFMWTSDDYERDLESIRWQINEELMTFKESTYDHKTCPLLVL